MIRLYDTTHRRVVPLETRDAGRVGMYLCGPTVYNYVHIGNARTIAWFEFIRRYLAYRGYEVTYVMNYTDVDDKIIERAKVEDTTPEEITERYSRAFEADMAAVGVRPPDILSRATDHISDMVTAIQGLIDRGAAYDADGDVFFSVEKFNGYGKLSGRTLEEMRAGERVEPHPGKHHPLDFSLWKSAKEGEPAWDSPWGPGRPGWHIECSVMSTRYLGMSFDLHGGATDLIFPHHENEIAQAEALEGTEPFVRHWLHAGLVQMDEEKMSKSLGNVVLAKDAVAHFTGPAVRYWILGGSYRTQASFSEDSLDDARQAYERWNNFLVAARHALGDRTPTPPDEPRRPLSSGAGFEGAGGPFILRFIDALDDNLSSPEAFAAVHDLVRQGNKLIEPAQEGDSASLATLTELTEAFLELTTVLGFSFDIAETPAGLTADLIEYLLELRDQARTEKAFERADSIRDKLSQLGVVIEDTSGGARWRVGDERIT